MGPNLIWLCASLQKGDIWTLRHEEREDDEKTGRTPFISQSHGKLWERHGINFPPQSSERVNPADTVILDIWTPELWKVNFYHISLPVCDILLWQSQQMNAGVIMWLKPSISEWISGFLWDKNGIEKTSFLSQLWGSALELLGYHGNRTCLRLKLAQWADWRSWGIKWALTALFEHQDYNILKWFPGLEF